MSGDTHFRVFPLILRPLRPLILHPLHPSNLRPLPSPPPTSFLNNAKSFRVCVSVRFPLSFYSLSFLFHPLFLFVLLINCGHHVYSYCHPVSLVSYFHFTYGQCCTLAGLHPFLLGSPARCANYCSILCQYIYLGSPASFLSVRPQSPLHQKRITHRGPIRPV